MAERRSLEVDVPDRITEAQIKEFAAAWFLALDRHVHIDEAYSFLAEGD
jgi:hypothetical protein